MIKSIFSAAVAALILCACGGSGSKTEPVTDTDVAEAFIKATLENKLDEAEKYLLKDSVNTQLMDSYREANKKLSADKLEAYKKSGIIIKEVKTVKADSMVIVSYAASYMPQQVNRLKLLRVDGRWLVDFKYTMLEKPEE